MINIGIHTGTGNHNKLIKLIKKTEGLNFTEIFLASGVDSKEHNFVIYDKFLSKCDGVLFVDYNKNQFETLKRSVKASKHIFIDSLKQIEDSEALELMKLAQEANVVFKIGLKNDFYSSLKKQIAFFQNPVLIETIINGNKQLNNENILNHYIIEFIYQFLKLIKGNFKRVTAKSVSIYNEHTDIANINLEFDNGSIVSICLNTIAKKRNSRILIYKHRTVSTIDLVKNVVRINSVEDKIKSKTRLLSEAGSKKEELVEFYQSIMNEKAISSSIENGVKALEIVNKIAEKIRITSNHV